MDRHKFKIELAQLRMGGSSIENTGLIVEGAGAGQLQMMGVQLWIGDHIESEVVHSRMRQGPG